MVFVPAFLIICIHFPEAQGQQDSSIIKNRIPVTEDLVRGERLFYGLAYARELSVNCASCHNTNFADTLNWNPDALEISRNYLGKNAADLSKVLLKPVGKKLMEVHRGFQLTAEDVELLKVYMDKFAAVGMNHQKPVITNLLLLIIAAIFFLVSSADLIFKKIYGKPGINLLIISFAGVVITWILAADAIRFGRSARKRLYEILETLPVMICLLTPDYHVSFANRAFRNQFGEARGRPCYEYCYNRKEPCDFCQTYEVLKTGSPHHWEITLADGTVIDINDFPFTDADGSMHILEMDMDITRQKNAENALIEQKEYLIDLNEKLLRSNKELESFAYITSHDLQEPLRMVTSFAQLLAVKYKGQIDKSGDEYIDFIVAGAKRMYDLINGLLAYSRIGRKEVLFSEVDINSVIEAVRINLDTAIKEKQCTIECGVLPVIVSDYNQLIQLFQNLISNAIKFSRGNPQISITSRKLNSEYLFSVKDRGIGIESQYFDRIFEIFKRLNARDDFEGTGIGLAICKKIVENHGGRIWVESELSSGSTFHFTIPFKSE